MSSYQLTVIEPSAIKMLEDMARKNLIKLSPLDSKDRFLSLLEKMRDNPNRPALEEISEEVDLVRTHRFFDGL